MKLTEKHFQIFKKECLKLQDIFELHNWGIHFRWQDDNEKARASSNTNVSGYITTLFLSKDWINYDKITGENIKQVAKHEMIHVLIARLDAVGGVRFASKDELLEANEELVRKLEYIIK